MQYFPLALPFLLVFWFLFALLVALIQVGILKYAFESMGVSRRYMFSLLVFSLIGSYINIPIARLPGGHMQAHRVVDFFGMEYVVPVTVHSGGTVVAVNLGGAIIPFVLSVYLIVKHGFYIRAFFATLIITLIVHHEARVVPEVGIAVPVFIPPIATAIVALLISRRSAAPLAYVAGSLGTLIGADLMNLNRIRDLGAPVASIGGAGKFDGIFLTGLVAVLLASIFGGRRRAEVGGS